MENKCETENTIFTGLPNKTECLYKADLEPICYLCQRKKEDESILYQLPNATYSNPLKFSYVEISLGHGKCISYYLCGECKNLLLGFSGNGKPNCIITPLDTE